jgi:hypothetical protein
MRTLLLALAVVPACVRSFSETVMVGPTFADHGHTAVVIVVEAAAITHEEFRPPHSEDGEDHGPTRYLGFAGAAGGGLLLGNKLGASAFASAGLDYIPFLYDSGTMVGFGGHVAAAVGAHEGIYAAAPRLWFAIPFATLAGKPLTGGLMLRCQIGLPDADGCGPLVVLARFVP